MDTVFVILPLTMNKILQRLTPLPIFMHNHSGVDSHSVTLGIISLFPYLLGSRFSPHLSGETTQTLSKSDERFILIGFRPGSLTVTAIHQAVPT